MIRFNPNRRSFDFRRFTQRCVGAGIGRLQLTSIHTAIKFCFKVILKCRFAFSSSDVIR